MKRRGVLRISELVHIAVAAVAEAAVQWHSLWLRPFPCYSVITVTFTIKDTSQEFVETPGVILSNGQHCACALKLPRKRGVMRALPKLQRNLQAFLWHTPPLFSRIVHCLKVVPKKLRKRGVILFLK